MFMLTHPPQAAPDKTTTVVIGFERGNPVSLNGEKLEPLPLFLELNRLGAANGIGRVDMVENRLVGMKSRGVYETPGGTILYKAHQSSKASVSIRRRCIISNKSACATPI